MGKDVGFCTMPSDPETSILKKGVHQKEIMCFYCDYIVWMPQDMYRLVLKMQILSCTFLCVGECKKMQFENRFLKQLSFQKMSSKI